MKNQMMLLKKIAMTVVLASVFVVLGCQKQEEVKTPDASESADSAAQAAQAATDAAYAATPSVDDAASNATATANSAAASAPVVMKSTS